jgi:hypothetical protein
VLARIGWLPETDAPGVLGVVRGIEVRRHPAARLRDDPQLWAVWDRWRSGYDRTPTDTEYDRISAWHLACLRQLRAAAAPLPRRDEEEPCPRQS